MKKVKYLFMLVAVGLLFGACSKDSDTVFEEGFENSPEYGKYSVEIEFDDDGFDPDWLIDFTGAVNQHEDDFGIEGLSITPEVEKQSTNKYFFLFTFSSSDNKAQKTYTIKYKYKTLGTNLIMGINGIEDVFPSGKAKVYKDDKLVNSFDIGTLTMIAHPYED